MDRSPRMVAMEARKSRSVLRLEAMVLLGGASPEASAEVSARSREEDEEEREEACEGVWDWGEGMGARGTVEEAEGAREVVEVDIVGAL